MTLQTETPSWTWREPPADRAPLRVPVQPSRLRVGQDDDVFAAVGEADFYSMETMTDPVVDGTVIRQIDVHRFLGDLGRGDLAPVGGNIYVYDCTTVLGVKRTVWAYTLPTRHPILDPHPVAPDDTSTALHDWAWRADRAVQDADHARRTASYFTAPPVEWEFRVHPATITDLTEQDRAAERAYVDAMNRGDIRGFGWPPRPVLGPPGDDGGWTVHGRPLQSTTSVEPGYLHAHQILPVPGGTP